jgi:hypothetical protein
MSIRPSIEIDGRRLEIPYPARVVLDLGLLLVILFDPDAHIPKFGQFNNLVALRRSGKLVWTCPLPTTLTGDCFIAAELTSPDHLLVRSFSSFDLVVDALTGAIEANEFTK